MSKVNETTATRNVLGRALAFAIIFLSASVVLVAQLAWSEPSSKPAIQCEGIYRTNKGDQKFDLKRTLQMGSLEKFEHEANGFYFSAQVDQSADAGVGEYWILISRAPDYLNGVSLKGPYLSGKSFKAGWVFPDVAVTVVCK